MLIGLHDAEYEQMKNKTFPNYALMKISSYHKQKGDTVEWFIPDKKEIYDVVYSSKVFDFTPENPHLPDHTIKGGTGYGVFADLPKEIDDCFPDYSIYPLCDYAIGFLTRGCINKCSFCVVPKKEGGIRSYRTWEKIVRPNCDKLVLMDNNILACEHGINQLKELGETEYKIDINQGLDVMLLNDEICGILSKIKWIKYIRFSCDKDYQIPYFKKAIELFKKHKIPVSKIFVYLLVTSDVESAENRVHSLHSICKSFSIYAQAEQNSLKGIIPNNEQKEFANRYVYGRLYKKESFREYCDRHNLNFSNSPL